MKSVNKEQDRHEVIMDVLGTTSSTGHLHGKVALDYKKVRKLSNQVFLVDFKGKGAFYAAKIIDLETSSDTDIENEFKGIRFGRMLRHKNLLPIITAFVENSNLWSITPYCDAPSAGDLCQPTGMDETVIAVIVQDILSGLDYLHDRGIIHRGVKGSHILLRPNEGKCFLTGINNSISVVEDGKWRSAVHDYPKNARDNLNWLAPEILEQNLLGYDCKSDIYSLGVTCCELANGAIPYANMEATEILLDKLTGNHPKPIDMTCAQFIKLPEGKAFDEYQEGELLFQGRHP